MTTLPDIVRNLSLRARWNDQETHKPKPKRKKRRRRRALRFCVGCNGRITRKYAKLCPDCHRTRNERRKLYYQNYHHAHREHRAEKARLRYRNKMQAPGWPEASRVRAQVTRVRNFLRRKVMREWGVDSSQAMQWIEQGTFPP